MDSSDEPMYVDCGVHGKRVAAILCRHLFRPEGEKVGFIENSSDPSDPSDLQAWCYKCEEVYSEEGGLTDRFKEFCDMKMVCVSCYQNSKLYHNKPS